MKKLLGVAVLVLSMDGQTALAGPKGAQIIPGPQGARGTQNMQGTQNIDASATRTQGPTDQDIHEAHPEIAAQGPAINGDIKNQQVMGSIKSASINAIEITAPGSHGDMRFQADPQSKITRDAKAATLADFKKGDQVRITYEMVKSERTIRSMDVIRASARIPDTGSEGVHNNAINNGGAINNGTGIIHK